MKKTIIVLAVLAVVSGSSVPAAAHCQIPCGIYGDARRIDMMLEDVQTIEKSVTSIQALAGKTSPADLNQLVRWIANKDEHADKIAESVTTYFLQQRIKAPQGDDAAALKKYTDQLTALHGILVTAMKAKQTVDPAVAATLRESIERFKGLYFTPEDLAHAAEHKR
jgi:nickel superoxide dismutase